jgi:hypothetical protein
MVALALALLDPGAVFFLAGRGGRGVSALSQGGAAIGCYRRAWRQQTRAAVDRWR